MIRAAARRLVIAIGELAEVIAAICAPDEPMSDRQIQDAMMADAMQSAARSGASVREATVGSIHVERRPGGNLEIDTTHTRGGLIRQGAVVVERADARDLIDALELVVGTTDDASSWPERCVVENGAGRRCNGKHWHAEAHDFSATGPGVNRWRGGPYADRDPARRPDADRLPCPTCGHPLTAIDPALVDKSGDLGCELGHRWNSLSLSRST